MDRQYVVKFGRTDGSATKVEFRKSRIQALRLANGLSYVLFYQHPFKNGEARGIQREEGCGFFVEYIEEFGTT